MESEEVCDFSRVITRCTYSRGRVSIVCERDGGVEIEINFPYSAISRNPKEVGEVLGRSLESEKYRLRISIIESD